MVRPLTRPSAGTRSARSLAKRQTDGATHYVLRTTSGYYWCYALRTTHYALRTTHYALRTTHYVLRTTLYVLRTTHYVLRTSYNVLLPLPLSLSPPLSLPLLAPPPLLPITTSNIVTVLTVPTSIACQNQPAQQNKDITTIDHRNPPPPPPPPLLLLLLLPPLPPPPPPLLRFMCEERQCWYQIGIPAIIKALMLKLLLLLLLPLLPLVRLLLL